MEIREVLYKDLDVELDKYYDSEEFNDEQYLIQDDSIGEDAILAFGPAWHVIDKGCIAIEGAYCNYNQENGMFEPDWSLTLLYKDDEELDVNRYLYYEQDSPAATICNYIWLTMHVA